MNNYQKGKRAEVLARLYLFFRGYRCVAQNYVGGRGTTIGEIDLIMRKKNTLIFVEVKQRESLEVAAYAISQHQKQRILRGAQNFLKKHPQYQGCDLRFDAVLVKLPLSVRHICNAWQAW